MEATWRIADARLRRVRIVLAAEHSQDCGYQSQFEQGSYAQSTACTCGAETRNPLLAKIREATETMVQ